MESFIMWQVWCHDVYALPIVWAAWEKLLVLTLEESGAVSCQTGFCQHLQARKHWGGGHKTAKQPKKYLNIRTQRGSTHFLSVQVFKSVQENHIHFKNQKFLRSQFKDISLSDILWHVPGIRYHVSLGWAFLMWLLLKVNKEHIIIWLKAAGIFQSSCVINATSWVLSFPGISLCWS